MASKVISVFMTRYMYAQWNRSTIENSWKKSSMYLDVQLSSFWIFGGWWNRIKVKVTCFFSKINFLHNRQFLIHSLDHVDWLLPNFGLIEGPNLLPIWTHFSLQYWKTVNCSYLQGFLRNNWSMLTIPLSQLLFDVKRMSEIQWLIAIKT